MTTLYHGTPDLILDDEELYEGLCATPDKSAAQSYGEAAGLVCRIYEVELAEGVRVADVSDLEDAAAELEIETLGGYTYELADDEDIRALLEARGFGAVAYPDVAPDNAFEHETVRALVDGALVLVP